MSELLYSEDDVRFAVATAKSEIERLQKEVNRRKSCILAMSEEIQTLVREAVDAQEKIRTYQQGAYK
jgi:prefoldin subunit 5